jgi:hypothetical protein
MSCCFGRRRRRWMDDPWDDWMRWDWMRRRERYHDRDWDEDEYDMRNRYRPYERERMY